MGHYHHLSIEEREKILLLYVAKSSLRSIAEAIGRSASTVSREIARNINNHKGYSAVRAEERYRMLREKCRRSRLLNNPERRDLVLKLFLQWQWSPEEIDHRLRLEKNPLRVSYSTIYRAIYAGMLDPPGLSHGNRGVTRKLRHRGKTRHTKGHVETRGKIVISNRIVDRPEEAASRLVIGHWEADTMAGKVGSACLVTIVDRCSRYLLAGKVTKKYSALVAQKMIDLLQDVSIGRRRSITPDRGMEFAKHSLVSATLDGVQFYFPDPHAPWQRGTSENTNGLIREYLPKSFDIAACPDTEIETFVSKLNLRPRKCLDWKSPYEVFFNQSLQLT